MASHTETDGPSIEKTKKSITAPFSEQIAREIGDFFVWTDIAAICYVQLKSVISSEISFLASYCSEGWSESGDNPNIGELESLTLLVKDTICSEMSQILTSESALKNIFDAVDNTPLIEFGKGDLNRATLHWAIIRGIDLAYGDCSNFSSFVKRGPLNMAKRDVVGVYLSSPKSALGEALLTANLKRIPDLTFNTQLSYIKFYDKAHKLSLPKVRLIKYDENQNTSKHLAMYGTTQLEHAASPNIVSMRDQANEAGEFPRHVRIGMALFSPAQLACIKKGEEQQSSGPAQISFVARQGKTLSATYDRSYAVEYKEIVTGALDLSARQGCQIVLFPEIVISAELRACIQGHLSQPDLERRPALVIAGSSWEPGEVHGNNVSFLFDGYGHEVGRYYKYSPFVKLDGAGQVVFVEGLDNPGKECVVVDIAALGRVLPSICKDLVDDGRYTLNLARSFQPNLVCASALSSSIDKGFSLPVNTLSERSLAITAVCDLCGYRMRECGDDTAVGLVGAPMKSAKGSTRTRTCDLKLMRDKKCRKECLALFHHKGLASCVHVVDIDCTTFGEDGYVTSQRIPLQ